MKKKGDGRLFPTIKLNDKKEIPALGFGTWCLGQREDRTFDKKVIHDAIQHAVKIGFRHIDCAQDYLNEQAKRKGRHVYTFFSSAPFINKCHCNILIANLKKEEKKKRIEILQNKKKTFLYLVGDALKELFNDKVVKREDLFITSKLNQPYHSAKHVELALQKTLLDLDLEYLDLYLIHWPMAFDFVDYGKNANQRGWNEGKYNPWDTKVNPHISIQETWKAMEELVKKGFVKSIGVSNFNVQLLRDLLSYATIPPVVNQVESHPYLTQSGLVKFCADNKIVVEAYSPLASPGHYSKTDPVLLNDKTLIKIANKHGKTPAQVALKWNLMRGENVVVITKASNPQRISENHSLLDFSLTDDDMKTLNSLKENHRYLRPQEWSVTKGIYLFD
ncbi:aldo-keto oxidoreductase [Reticulomyxa filosa]|uniref:Aldo-keto oxidoreductase n=1 Tax=Reticulomyxa filosa TaxID=46433 RepID=X6PFB2_RETFI|nr:aldo-keto oxidoreductase [Reticulomyxa filosa]|eukprot:ETO36803.1 aldo-keto oxidoreductase [Reticulomyxa filosa]